MSIDALFDSDKENSTIQWSERSACDQRRPGSKDPIGVHGNSCSLSTVCSLLLIIKGQRYGKLKIKINYYLSVKQCMQKEHKLDPAL